MITSITLKPNNKPNLKAVKKENKIGNPSTLVHNYSTQNLRAAKKCTKYVKKLESTLHSNDVSRNDESSKHIEVNQRQNAVNLRSIRNTIHSHSQMPSVERSYIGNHIKGDAPITSANISMNLHSIFPNTCKANQAQKCQLNTSIKECKNNLLTLPNKMSETMKTPHVQKKEAPRKFSKQLKGLVTHQSTKALNSTFSITTKTIDLNTSKIRLTTAMPSPVNSPPGCTTPVNRKKNFTFGECAINNYRRELTDYELKEILQYPEVYYPGKIYNKLKALNKEGHNNGFDDKKGFYLVKEHDHLMYRYEIISLLGNGSFGHVYKCLDYKTNELVAIKILRNKEKFHKQGQVEIDIINALNTTSQRESQYVVTMKHNFVFRNHICISFEILSMDLFELIKSSGFVGFALPLVKSFAKQLLIVLDYMKRLNIIHCDLKPENILLKAPKKSAIKVIDFGTGCFSNSTYYTYIQSRYYRAPEIMIGNLSP